MSVFLFIHGSYHGAWCWEKVKALLEKKGNIIFALDLPGHGKDQTSRSIVTMDLYVRRVAEFIDEKNLRDFILVGHSMGGIVASLIAEKFPNRIKKLVFIAGMILDNNESLLDLIPESRRIQYLETAAKRADKSIPVNPGLVRDYFLNDCNDEAAISMVLAKLTPQPIASDAQKIRLTTFKELDIPTTYIFCSRDKAIPAESFKKFFVRLPPNHKIVTIESGHEPMITHSSELANLLENELL